MEKSNNLTRQTSASTKQSIHTIFAALCAIGIAFGMSRFTYASLVPSLIKESWVTLPQAGFLGGTNSIGYMMSCIFVAISIRHFGVRRTLQSGLVIGVIGALMSSFDLNFGWLAFARWIAGVSAAPLLILTPSVLVNNIPDSWHKISTGLAFSGGGIFTVFTALTIPIFLHQGVQSAWFYELLIISVATIAVWPLTRLAPSKPSFKQQQSIRTTGSQKQVLLGLRLALCFGAMGAQAPLILLTDYLHKNLHLPINTASEIFSAVGIGFICGAACSGILITFFGSRMSLLIVQLTGVASLALILISQNIMIIGLAAALIGFFVLGSVASSSHRSMEVVGQLNHPISWSKTVFLTGLGSVIGANGLSYLLYLGNSYQYIFSLAIVALVLAFVFTAGLSCRCLANEA